VAASLIRLSINTAQYVIKLHGGKESQEKARKSRRKRRHSRCLFLEVDGGGGEIGKGWMVKRPYAIEGLNSHVLALSTHRDKALSKQLVHSCLFCDCHLVGAVQNLRWGKTRP
jgi:hypothetical protein